MKLPAVLAFTLLGGGAIFGVAASCDHGGGSRDAAVEDARTDAPFCQETCVHDDPAQEACGCPDASFQCPDGCYVCSLFCIPDGTDAGVAQCSQCAARDGTCPTGCRPVG